MSSGQHVKERAIHQAISQKAAICRLNSNATEQQCNRASNCQGAQAQRFVRQSISKGVVCIWRLACCLPAFDARRSLHTFPKHRWFVSQNYTDYHLVQVMRVAVGAKYLL